MRTRGTRRRRKRGLLLAGLGGAVLLGALAVGVVVAHWSGARSEAAPRSPGAETARIAVKTIRPKYSPAFVRSVKEPAYVEPYYRADLYAHVAGPVKYIEKNIGDRVARGELLVEIDVPDLIQEIAQKEALIQQAIADRDEAEALVRTQEQAVATAKLRIPEKQAAQEEAVAIRELREDELRRYEILAKRQATTGDVVEERKKDLKAATAAGKSAELAVETARSELRLSEAKLDAARADLKVKEARITVAREDKAQVEAKADFAKIRAPFDATIVARRVDPGSFVQNATTAHTEPFLSLVRLDLVTVSMKAPEKAAPFVSTDTEALIHLDANAGQPVRGLRGKVARLSHYLDPDRGRTMQVEVDLYNPPERDYPHALVKGITSFLAPLGTAQPGEAAALLAAGQQVAGRQGLLLPGMYGTMELVLQKFEKAYLVPAGAVFTQGGNTYVFQVVNGIARRVPVRVQLEDGVQAKVAVIVRPADPVTGDDEVLQDFTGTEEIVRSGQGELSEGQEVRSVLVEW